MDNIHNLKIGDKLQFVKTKDYNKEQFINDILTVINIENCDNNTLWISHTPNSFSKGGFRIANLNGYENSYFLGRHVIYYDKYIKEKHTNLIKLLKKFKII